VGVRQRLRPLSPITAPSLHEWRAVMSATTTATPLSPITAPSLYERRAVMGVLRTTTISPYPITAPSLHERRAVMCGRATTNATSPPPLLRRFLSDAHRYQGNVTIYGGFNSANLTLCSFLCIGSLASFRGHRLLRPTSANYGSVALRVTRCGGRATTTATSLYPITAPSLYE
jgi:hypothetical protein